MYIISSENITIVFGVILCVLFVYCWWWLLDAYRSTKYSFGYIILLKHLIIDFTHFFKIMFIYSIDFDDSWWIKLNQFPSFPESKVLLIANLDTQQNNLNGVANKSKWRRFPPTVLLYCNEVFDSLATLV